MPVHVSPRPHGSGYQLTVTGIVTSRELKQGLLQLVRVDGWTEPLLWDFEGVSEIRVGLRDLTDITAFIDKFMGHFPARSRVAFLVPTAEARATAMSYRELQPPRLRAHMAVFSTRDEADTWLDAEALRLPVEPRATRVSLRDVVASLGHVACQVLNVSRSGALLETPGPVRAGIECLLTLRHGTLLVDLRVCVTRAHPVPPSDADGLTGAWRVAVRFLSPAEAQEQVAALVEEHLGVPRRAVGRRQNEGLQ